MSPFDHVSHIEMVRRDNALLFWYVRYVMMNLPVPVTENEVEEMINTADVNKDGVIDFQEFRNMLGQ